MKHKLIGLVASLGALSLGLGACSPSGGPPREEQKPTESATSVELGISDADYSLDKLVKAAKKEGPIVVVDATGKIKKMAEEFTAKYGIEATGVKMSSSEQEEVLEREHSANNVQSDVFNMSNLPDVTSKFLPEGIGVSWMPPDLKDQVPTQYQDPAITSLNPWMWVYNNETATECPISNWWELTDPEWKGKVSIPDPQLRNETMFWFNQIATHGDAEMAKAYEEHYGEKLPAGEDSAMKLWVKKFAANQPNLQKSDSDVGPVVGASGQSEPFVGFVSAAIFRDAKKNDFHLGACRGLKPWIGQLTPRVAVIAAGTKHPNAAKLFVHFMMSGEGMAPQMKDGKIPSNTTVTMPEDEASGVAEYTDEFYVNHSESTKEDYLKLQDWQDLWITSH